MLTLTLTREMNKTDNSNLLRSKENNIKISKIDKISNINNTINSGNNSNNNNNNSSSNSKDKISKINGKASITIKIGKIDYLRLTMRILNLWNISLVPEEAPNLNHMMHMIRAVIS